MRTEQRQFFEANHSERHYEVLIDAGVLPPSFLPNQEISMAAAADIYAVTGDSWFNPLFAHQTARRKAFNDAFHFHNRFTFEAPVIGKPVTEVTNFILNSNNNVATKTDVVVAGGMHNSLGVMESLGGIFQHCKIDNLHLHFISAPGTTPQSRTLSQQPFFRAVKKSSHLEPLADWLMASVSQFGINQPTFLGISMGGYLGALSLQRGWKINGKYPKSRLVSPAGLSNFPHSLYKKLLIFKQGIDTERKMIASNPAYLARFVETPAIDPIRKLVVRNKNERDYFVVDPYWLSLVSKVGMRNKEAEVYANIPQRAWKRVRVMVHEQDGTMHADTALRSLQDYGLLADNSFYTGGPHGSAYFHPHVQKVIAEQMIF